MCIRDSRRPAALRPDHRPGGRRAGQGRPDQGRLHLCAQHHLPGRGAQEFRQHQDRGPQGQDARRHRHVDRRGALRPADAEGRQDRPRQGRAVASHRRGRAGRARPEARRRRRMVRLGHGGRGVENPRHRLRRHQASLPRRPHRQRGGRARGFPGDPQAGDPEAAALHRQGHRVRPHER